MADSEHFRKTKFNKEVEVDKKGDYQTTCKSKPVDAGFNSSGERRSEVHHIVCEHSIAERFDSYPDPATATYIENCLWITKWDINGPANLVGMPRNRRFRIDWATEPESMWTPIDLPSHMVDHNTLEGYTAEVKTWLKKNLWDTIQAKGKKPHEADVKQIKEMLEKASGHFLTILRGRAIRPPGMIEGWKHRGDPAFSNRWYYPFSMGSMPAHRDPGAPVGVALGVFKKLD